MGEYQVLSVFSAYHGCGDAWIVEGRGTWSWRALIQGRATKVEVHFLHGLVDGLSYLHSLGSGEDPGAFLEAMIRNQVEDFGPPSAVDATEASWDMQGATVLVALERSGQESLILVRIGKKP